MPRAHRCSPVLARPATGMMCAVRRLLVARAGLVSLSVAIVIAGITVVAVTGAGLPAAASPEVSVRTVLGPGVLDGPGGIALDAAGTLVVADTGHCRVVAVTSQAA